MAGADAVKVGIGPGSICTTRVVTGVGVPQITAVMNAVAGVREAAGGGTAVPVIADGGIRQSGDIAKALAAGADVGDDGQPLRRAGREPGRAGDLGWSSVQELPRHGLGGGDGARAVPIGTGREAPRPGRRDRAAEKKFVPEGVEGLVPYRGAGGVRLPARAAGIRSAMGYCGCATIATSAPGSRFTRVSHATIIENHPHDIRITKESPNYSMVDAARAGLGGSGSALYDPTHGSEACGRSGWTSSGARRGRVERHARMDELGGV
jgi:IMP dehydrogenase